MDPTLKSLVPSQAFSDQVAVLVYKSYQLDQLLPRLTMSVIVILKNVQCYFKIQYLVKNILLPCFIFQYYETRIFHPWSMEEKILDPTPAMLTRPGADQRRQLDPNTLTQLFDTWNRVESITSIQHQLLKFWQTGVRTSSMWFFLVTAAAKMGEIPASGEDCTTFSSFWHLQQNRLQYCNTVQIHYNTI